jgi:hypothetical protein
MDICKLLLFWIVAFEQVVVVETESRDATSPPASEGELRVEEKVEFSEQPEASEVDENDLTEDTAQVETSLPHSEEPASPPVHTTSSLSSLPAEEDGTSTGEKPKVSYASIVSYFYVGLFRIAESWEP